MAIKIARKRRKNADGSYDIVHYETQAKAVWMADGRSVEEAVGGGSGGSGGRFVVTITSAPSDTENATIDKTFAQILEAHQAGMEVVAFFEREALYLRMFSLDAESAAFSTQICTVDNIVFCYELFVSNSSAMFLVHEIVSGGSGGGSTEKFIVTAKQGTQNGTLGAPYSGVCFAVTDVSHSYDEIIAAYNAGKEIELQLYASSATDSSGTQITQTGTSFFPLSAVFEIWVGTKLQRGIGFDLGMKSIGCSNVDGIDTWIMYQYY